MLKTFSSHGYRPFAGRLCAGCFSDLLGATRPIHDRCREFSGDSGLGRFLHSMLANPTALLARRNQPRDNCTKIHLFP
jgi:hypothetical protein